VSVLTLPSLPTVDQLFGLWVTKDPGGFAADSQNLTDFESTLHDVLLGDPAEELARITGIPDLAGVEFLAQAIPLPGDKTLNSASQYIAVTGIVAGIGTANPVLVYASLKVLAHHELHAAVAAAVRSLINQPTSPPSVREVPATANGNDPISPEPTELGDSGLSPGFSP
jgi:hypothetical protein